jgi:flagellar basal-body rod protein FlgC
MNLFGMMDISGSALKAERVRAEVVASNMANSETTRTADGGPYRRHHVVFSAADSNSFGASLLGHAATDSPRGGVDVSGVIEDQGTPLMRFDPQHPDAGADGYVAYPDINPLTEMVDLMGATRSYGLNASAVQAEKGMLANSLEILK